MTDPSRLVVLHLDTERGWRGGERQALWLARSLADRGHVSMVAARPGEPFAQRAAQAGLTVVPCAPGFEFDPVAVLELRAVIRRRRVQIVHAHTGHAVALAALATIGTDAKTVVTRRVDSGCDRTLDRVGYTGGLPPSSRSPGPSRARLSPAESPGIASS
ncbi:MAG: glycosyltransferase [Gemmatimonadaceae bacterium]